MDKREKHSPEEKIAAVKTWMNNEIGLKELARQFKTTDGRISEWINQYKEKGISAFIHQKNNNIYIQMLLHKHKFAVQNLRIQNRPLCMFLIISFSVSPAASRI